MPVWAYEPQYCSRKNTLLSFIHPLSMYLSFTTPFLLFYPASSTSIKCSLKNGDVAKEESLCYMQKTIRVDYPKTSQVIEIVIYHVY